MSHDLHKELKLDGEKAWGSLTDHDRDNAIDQLETLCVKHDIQWGSCDQRKALVRWRLYNLQIAARGVHKRSRAKGIN